MQSQNLFKTYWSLTKSSITQLVTLTVSLGFFLALSREQLELSLWVSLFSILTASLILCAGVCAMNNVLERKNDARMKRTQNRAIPKKLITPSDGFAFAACLIIFGLGIMYFSFGLPMFFGGMATTILYLVIYTPLKQKHWLNTTIGAIPGALPPIGGWIAANIATGTDFSWKSLLPFFLLFFWQHPHFYAIAWNYREDYFKGGFKMISLNDNAKGRVGKEGDKTFFHILLHSGLLFCSSILLGLLFSGWVFRVYVGIAIVLNLWFLKIVWQANKIRTQQATKKVVLYSVIYLFLLSFVLICLKVMELLFLFS